MSSASMCTGTRRAAKHQIATHDVGIGNNKAPGPAQFAQGRGELASGLAKKVIALEDLGSLALNGLTQPVSTFNVPLPAAPPVLLRAARVEAVRPDRSELDGL